MKVSKSFKKETDYYALEKDNGNDRICSLKFSQCDDNRFQLWNLNKNEIELFISYAKKIEKLSWQEIYEHRGLNYEKINNLRTPDYLDSEVSLYSMRVSQKFRILGYRSYEFFYIVWFDNNHETC